MIEGEQFRRGHVHHRLGRYIRATMRSRDVPGAAVAIILPGEVDAVAGFGTGSVEYPSPVSGSTLFQVGSITKTVTATAVMRLCQDGVLDLDAPVRSYVRPFRLADAQAARTVTLRHLLTHTAGWEGDLAGDFGRGDDALATLVGAMSRLNQLTPPGSTWSYNNVGFSLAGRVIEVVTGEPFEKAIERLVLEPLGLSQSVLLPEDALGRPVAAGHVVGPRGARVAHPWAQTRASGPAGGFISSATDLLRYLRFHLGEGTWPSGQVLTKRSVCEMQSPQAVAGNFADSVGISWLLEEVGGERVVFHNGDTIIHQSLVALVPSRKFALAVVSNANTGAGLCDKVLDWTMAHYLGLRRRPPRFIALSRSQLTEYAGTYRSPLWDFHVVLEGDGLEVRVRRRAFLHPVQPRPPEAPSMRLSFIAEDAVRASGCSSRGTRGEFLRDNRGEVVWFRFLGRLARRQSGQGRG